MGKGLLGTDEFSLRLHISPAPRTNNASNKLIRFSVQTACLRGRGGPRVVWGVGTSRPVFVTHRWPRKAGKRLLHFSLCFQDPTNERLNYIFTHEYFIPVMG